MSEEPTEILLDYQNRAIRLTRERQMHILKHPEMVGQLSKIADTLLHPEFIIATKVDEMVHVYHRHYPKTPVTSKYLLVAVKLEADNAFVLTAFFSSRQKKGITIWQA